MIQRILIIFVTLIFILSCDSTSKSSKNYSKSKNLETSSVYQISLAQWSLHRSFLGPKKEGYWEWYAKMSEESPDSLLRGELDPKDFPTIAAGYGVKSIELVSIFYSSKADNKAYWIDFNKQCKKVGVTVGLIMCDGLGDLGHADSEARLKAVENHYKWIDISKFIGAHSIRVNVAGQGSPNEVASNVVDALIKLGKYAASKGINVIVENHGGYSSDGKWLAAVMKEVGMDNVGTLPDFGNFCIKTGPDGCIEEYDRYQGMMDLMPYAKGVSAKSYEFDEKGNEINSDFYRIMKIVKESGYKGFIGIEYEGSTLSEEEGIKATKALLEKAIKGL